MFLGVVFFLATIFLAYRAGRGLGGERAGKLAGALVALNGPVAWGFLYGSDIALFMFLGTWLLDRLVDADEPGGLRGLALPGVLLSLARPEGLPIAVLLAAFGLWRARDRRDRVLSFAPLAAALAVLVLYKAVTGAWLGTSVADKSLFANYGLVSGVALCAQYGVDVLRGLLLGFYPSEVAVGFSRGFAPFYFPPLGLLLVVLFAAMAPDKPRGRTRQWLLLVAVAWALVTPNVFMGVHFNRYLMWAFPGLLCLMACGLVLLAQRIAGGDARSERRVFAAAASLALVLGALSTLRFAGLYADGAGEVWRRDVATARFISANLPRGVAIANIATSIEYLTGHRNLNLHGVTSPAFFGNRTAEREAGVFESLGRLPESQRPTLLLSSVATQDGSPLLRRLAPAPAVFQSTSFSDELVLLRMDYSLVGSNRILRSAAARSAVLGLAEMDRLNVGDVADEAAHRYERSSHLGDLVLEGRVRIDSYPPDPSGAAAEVADAGRVILGQQTLRVRSRAGRDLVVVMRTAGKAEVGVLGSGSASGVHEIELAEASLAVFADGKDAGRFRFRPGAGWDDVVFRVPAALVGEGSTELRLQGRYASFYLWFYQ
jgi:hypothetical protein